MRQYYYIVNIWLIQQCLNGDCNWVAVIHGQTPLQNTDDSKK